MQTNPKVKVPPFAIGELLDLRNFLGDLGGRLTPSEVGVNMFAGDFLGDRRRTAKPKRWMGFL
jgi:hypothetical protein